MNDLSGVCVDFNELQLFDLVIITFQYKIEALTLLTIFLE